MSTDSVEPIPQPGDVWEERSVKRRRVLVYRTEPYAHLDAMGIKVYTLLYEGPNEGRMLRMSSRVMQRSWTMIGVDGLALKKHGGAV